MQTPTLLLLGLGIAVVAGLVIAWRIRSAARVEVFNEIKAKRADAAEAKKEKDDEVANLGPADLDARFNRWMRDDDSGR